MSPEEYESRKDEIHERILQTCLKIARFKEGGTALSDKSRKRYSDLHRELEEQFNIMEKLILENLLYRE